MREVDRVGVIREVLGRRLRPGGGIGAAGDLRAAGEAAGAAVPGEEGARGLRSRRRGRRASNGIAPELRREIVGVVRERYEDFAPTLAWEKLTEVHGYGVSVETLRKWMVAEGLWRSKKRPGARVHQSRPRRPALGELGADRRFPPRVVRGSGAALHVDCVHRRRHQSADGAAFCRGRDHRSLHEDLARVSRPTRPPGGHLLGQAQHLPGQSKGSRRRSDPVHSDAQDPGHPAHPRQHPPGQRPRGKGQTRPSRTGW